MDRFELVTDRKDSPYNPRLVENALNTFELSDKPNPHELTDNALSTFELTDSLESDDIESKFTIDSGKENTNNSNKVSLESDNIRSNEFEDSFTQNKNGIIENTNLESVNLDAEKLGNNQGIERKFWRDRQNVIDNFDFATNTVVDPEKLRSFMYGDGATMEELYPEIPKECPPLGDGANADIPHVDTPEVGVEIPEECPILESDEVIEPPEGEVLPKGYITDAEREQGYFSIDDSDEDLRRSLGDKKDNNDDI